MGKYILRRILYAIPIAFGVSVVCFSLVYLAPGDPLQTVVPPDATAETIEIIKRAYGFDKPLPMQFLIWLGRVADRRFRHVDRHQAAGSRRDRPGAVEHGAAGDFRGAARVLDRLCDGRAGRLFPGTWIDRVVTGGAVFGVSLPNYWLGIVLVIVFAVELSILPATGMGLQGSSEFNLLRWSDARFLILPVVTLSMVPIGILSRTTRAAVAELRNQDFVQTLRANGPVGMGRH